MCVPFLTSKQIYHNYSIHATCIIIYFIFQISVLNEKIDEADEREPLSPIATTTICTHLADWRMLAAGLHLPPETISDIEQGHRRVRDCCRAVLETTNTGRKTVSKVLKDMKHVALAEALECGSL